MTRTSVPDGGDSASTRMCGPECAGPREDVLGDARECAVVRGVSAGGELLGLEAGWRGIPVRMAGTARPLKAFLRRAGIGSQARESRLFQGLSFSFGDAKGWELVWIPKRVHPAKCNEGQREREFWGRGW